MNNRELIMAFKQGEAKNCVSIAIIKAGIEIFGINKVFHHYWDGDTCEVTMRDGFQLRFTRDQLEEGSRLSSFEKLNNEEAYNYANLCFTAMAVRAKIEENDNIPDMTFQKAAESLNNGENYLEGPHWLGLGHHYVRIGRKYIWQYKGVIGASRKHCFFASQGYEDDYGKVDYISKLERPFCKWFRVTENNHH